MFLDVIIFSLFLLTLMTVDAFDLRSKKQVTKFGIKKICQKYIQRLAN